MVRSTLITGGAGFIGIHTCDAFAAEGIEVCLVDNFSRRGAELNLKWLQERHAVRVERIDVRDSAGVAKVFADFQPDAVIHLAGQVAVTTSVVNPREDFEINALGTLNVLEALRLHCPSAFLIYSSTNKVYGKMESLGIVERDGRWEYSQLQNGVDELHPLDFHSPYGCSKGAADQYVLDYSRIYGLKTTAFRQSCIYGTRQFGIEDQGWVAWFSIASALNKKITIYGDGKQIRDVLHVRDLVAAYQAAIDHSEAANGQAFNIGGGPQNTMSLHELLNYIEQVLGYSPEISYADWRPGDQKVFVCNLSRAQRLLGWRPRISVRDGVVELISWAKENSHLFEHL